MTNFFSSKTALAALGAAVLLMAAPAGAQSTSQMKVDVPFSFTAGKQLFRAGVYRIDVDGAHQLCRITASDGSVNLIRVQPGMASRPRRESDRAIVRFAKDGDRFVLETVWQTGSVEGNTVLRRSFETAKAGGVRDVGSF